jgi:signal transduction histidine kinase
LLSTHRLPLDEDKYRLIKACFAEIRASFLPGQDVKPFYRQIVDRLATYGVETTPTAVANLIREARELGLADFPRLQDRTMKASSEEAGRLHAASPPVRMSHEEYAGFAKIYRELFQAGYHKKKKGGRGFFAEAAERLAKDNALFTSQQLASYARYRRTIGDLNFPRLRGSSGELDRIHIAAVERMQALGVLATGLMHEIRQPLQVIRLDADLQLRELDSNGADHATLRKRLTEIVEQVERMNTVVEHVRTIARAREIKVEAVSLSEALAKALMLIGVQLRSRGVDVDDTGLPPQLPLVRADFISLEQIFINLLTNARDAIEEAGKGRGKVVVRAHVANGSVICEVEDNGTGIARENLDRIFDPYFTTKPVGKGTGMGLTEVLNSMVLFGGRVTVHSMPGEGATVTLEFQRHES